MRSGTLHDVAEDVAKRIPDRTVRGKPFLCHFVGLTVSAFLITHFAFTAVAQPDNASEPYEPRAIPVYDPVVYRNYDYQFAVDLPKGYLACVGNFTSHGTFILLQHGDDCDTSPSDSPVIYVGANYTAALEAPATILDLAISTCTLDGESPKKRIWLRRKRLGNHPAAGCRLEQLDGTIDIRLVTLRRTEPAPFWGSIEIGASLKTTPARFKADNEVFERVIKGIKIPADGPTDYRHPEIPPQCGPDDGR